MDRAYELKLMHSCRVLFGTQAKGGRDFLFCLELSGVKSAFRRKALMTHPDRAALRSRGKGGAEPFLAVKDAYNQLVEFIGKRHTMRRPERRRTPSSPIGNRRSARPGRHAARRHGTGNTFRGALPRRRLLLGEFLYYSGFITWESLMKAIVWQRRQRPRLGEIACSWGWISSSEALAVARGKRIGTPMGEALVQSELLSRTQVRSIVSRQRRMQSSLGKYFISRRILTPAALGRLIAHYRVHNSAYSAPAF
jgi:hypothetical protein